MMAPAAALWTLVVGQLFQLPVLLVWLVAFGVGGWLVRRAPLAGALLLGAVGTFWLRWGLGLGLQAVWLTTEAPAAPVALLGGGISTMLGVLCYGLLLAALWADRQSSSPG